MTHPLTTPAHALRIGETLIRQDHEGRFCLNDLHAAAGGERRHQPANWVVLRNTREMIDQLAQELGGAEHAILSRQGLGSFVCQELVYAYAMWVSPAFQLKVIRAYDAMMREPARAVPASLPDFTDPVAAARAWADEAERARKLEHVATAQREALNEAHDRLEAVRPAVEFHRAVTRSDDLVSIQQFAQLMGIGAKGFFEMLRAEKVLITGGERHNFPMQAHMRCGRFQVRETVYRGHDDRDHLYCRTFITPKGQLWLQRQYFPEREPHVFTSDEIGGDPVQQALDFRAPREGQDSRPAEPIRERYSLPIDGVSEALRPRWRVG